MIITFFLMKIFFLTKLMSLWKLFCFLQKWLFYTGKFGNHKYLPASQRIPTVFKTNNKKLEKRRREKLKSALCLDLGFT